MAASNPRRIEAMARLIAEHLTKAEQKELARSERTAHRLCKIAVLRFMGVIR